MMHMNYDLREGRPGGHRGFDEMRGFEGFRPREGRRGVFDGPRPEDLRGIDGDTFMEERGESSLPFRGRGMRGFGPDSQNRFGGRGGFPPRGGRPPFGGMPPHGAMPPHGGMPSRRPNPEFLRRRAEEADLAELIDMAGRMLHSRPRGGYARGQALILSILAGREVISQRELQQMLGIQPGSLSELISKLEAKGYLRREKAEDRRGNLLRITDEGRRAIPQAEDAGEDDPFAPLTQEQQNQLGGMLRALVNGWIDRLAAEADRPVQI